MAKYNNRSQNTAPTLTPQGGFAPMNYSPSNAPLLDANGNLSLAGLMGQYQNAMASQNQNNATLANNLMQGWNNLGNTVLSQYAQNEANIVQGYGQNINNVMGTLGNQQAAGQQGINDQWNAQASQGAQNLTNLGMAGTTVAPTMAAGYQNQKQQNLNQFNTAQAATQAQTLAGLNSQDLAAQQAATQGLAAMQTGLGEGALNSYGSMNLGGSDASTWANLLESLGKSGGAGGGGGIPQGSVSVPQTGQFNVPSMNTSAPSSNSTGMASMQTGSSNPLTAMNGWGPSAPQGSTYNNGVTTVPGNSSLSNNTWGPPAPEGSTFQNGVTSVPLAQSESVKPKYGTRAMSTFYNPVTGNYGNNPQFMSNAGAGGGVGQVNYMVGGGNSGAIGNNSSTNLSNQLGQSTAPNLTAGNPLAGMNMGKVNWGAMAPGLAGETAYTPAGVGSGPQLAPAGGAGSITRASAPQTRMAGNPWGGSGAGAPLTNPVTSQYGQAQKMAANPMMAGFKGKYRMM